MATRTKTIEFAAPNLASLPDNTLTAMTQFTAYIPEWSGTVTFKKVWVKVAPLESSSHTPDNDYDIRRVDVSVGGASATSYANSNVLDDTGENTQVPYTCDCTAHFVSNWTSGTSKTVDLSVLYDCNDGTPSLVNVSAVLFITLEYDDTQSTQVKTVYIPLDCPVGALGTSKPGSANATIPQLTGVGGLLTETTATVRDIHIVLQGNMSQTSAAGDGSITQQIGSLTAFETADLEGSNASDYWFWLVWKLDIAGMSYDTGSSYGWYVWSDYARNNHNQAWMVVTYEFDASGETGAVVQVLLPCRGAGPMGGSTSADYQSLDAELWIEEPGTITTVGIAFYAFWRQAAPVAGINLRVGTGSFVAYTDQASTLCGTNGAMVRNDGAYTLARGKNTLRVSAYRTDTADLGWAFGGFWIVTYTAGKPGNGYGAANHTIRWPLVTMEGAASSALEISATAPVIADSAYYLSGCGLIYDNLCYTSTYAMDVQVERTAAEGGVAWLGALSTQMQDDTEAGVRVACCDMLMLFVRWPNDTGLAADGLARLDIETSRRWATRHTVSSIALFRHIDLILTYHSNTFTVAGTIGIGSASTLTLTLEREVSSGVWEHVLTGSRSGDGAYSFTWYDNTQKVHVRATDGTLRGCSLDGYAV